MLNILEKFVTSKGYTYFRLDGSTPVASRQGLIKKYNEVKLESVLVMISLSLTSVTRELKLLLRRRQRKRQKTIGFMRKQQLYTCITLLSTFP